jgi:hypothetical protein
MCRTIDPESYIRRVLDFGIKTGYDKVIQIRDMGSHWHSLLPLCTYRHILIWLFSSCNDHVSPDSAIGLLVKCVSPSFAIILQIKNIHYDYLEYGNIAFLVIYGLFCYISFRLFHWSRGALILGFYGLVFRGFFVTSGKIKEVHVWVKEEESMPSK